MRKSAICLLSILHIAAAKILGGVEVGSGLRYIKQNIDVYYSSYTKIPASIKFDSKVAPTIFAKLDLPLIPALEIKYSKYNLKGSLNKATNFYFGDIQVTTNNQANITLNQNTKELNIDFYYSFPIVPFFASLKAGLGSDIFDIKLNAIANFADGEIKSDTYSISFLPIPYLYSSLDCEKGNFIFNFKINLLPKITVKGYSAKYISLSPTINYKILSLPLFKLITYVSYDFSKLKITSDKFYFDRKTNNLEVGGYANIGF